jgi:ABC-2 type transport system ATP-binding protein
VADGETHAEEDQTLTEVIVTRGLTKKYADFSAVEDLNLAVNYSEIFGFLGPNGAGKTTTIRVLTTLAKPTSGSVWITGFDVTKEPAKVKKP